MEILNTYKEVCTLLDEGKGRDPIFLETFNKFNELETELFYNGQKFDAESEKIIDLKIKKDLCKVLKDNKDKSIHDTLTGIFNALDANEKNTWLEALYPDVDLEDLVKRCLPTISVLKTNQNTDNTELILFTNSIALNNVIELGIM